MDELVISGKRFISSRRVAKENGYHTDYIGQLIRGGKIKGQKVGRAWYVDAASFDAYLGSEGSTSTTEVTPAANSVAVAEDNKEVSVEEISTSRDPIVQDSNVQSGSETEKITSEPEAAVETEEAITESEAVEENASAEKEVAIDNVVLSEDVAEAESAPLTIKTKVNEDIVTRDTVEAHSEVSGAEPETEETKITINAKSKTLEPIQSSEDASEEIRVPSVVTMRKLSQASGAKKGLRYLSEDEVLIPEIRKSDNESRVPKKAIKSDSVISREVETGDEDIEEAVVTPTSRRSGVMVAGVAFAGILVFALSTIFSSAFSQTIQIQEGNTASSGYSLNW